MKKNVMWVAVISGLLIATAWASTAMRDLVITSSSVDSTPIGSTTPSTANFTTLKLNGSAPLGHVLIGDGTSYIDSGTLQDNYNQFAGCSYPNDGANITCTSSVTLTPAMPDTNYYVACSWSSPINPYMIFNYNITSMTTSGYSYVQLTSGSSSNFSTYGANYGLTVVCHAHHN